MAKNRLKFVLITLVVVCTILAAGTAFYAHRINTFAATPLNPEAQEVLFSINKGQSLRSISKQLKEKSLISNDQAFMVYARFKQAGKKLKAGDYLLSAADSPGVILDTLLSGRVKLYRTTIPEGYNMYQVADVFSQAGFCSSEDFILNCTNQEFVQQLGIKALTLEGYLFPDTYFFSKETSCEQIIETMVKRFYSVFNDTLKVQAQQMGFSIHDVVTLASIIEKETGDASERPLISSVFHNRLRINMRLESDPTVIYGIENFDGNIKRKHLREVTPYNTYRIKGLPIGPIANPGKHSIEAALNPAESDYLFFVSKKDTTHYFSRTIQEHNRAVRKYQLRRR